MLLWKISIFEESQDNEPTKTGYVNVSSEEEATSIAKEEMGDAKRADLKPGGLEVNEVSSLPTGKVFWE